MITPAYKTQGFAYARQPYDMTQLLHTLTKQMRREVLDPPPMIFLEIFILLH